MISLTYNKKYYKSFVERTFESIINNIII